MAWERLSPALPVTVVQVVAGGERMQVGDAVAKATGWFQPDPHPIAVSAQRAGTLIAVHVRAGDAVTAGTVIARMDDRDAEIACRVADMDLLRAARERDRAEADVTVAEARLALARDRHGRLHQAATAASADHLAQAAHEVAVREAEAILARSAVALAACAVQSAELARASAALDLERCRITAPVDGIILRLAAVPGQRMGLDDAGSALVAELFDPGRVQVRADVPLAESAAVQPGMRAEVSCDLIPDRPLIGRVVVVAGQADAARNTLPVHVAIDAPPAGLRPDMLARVRFLSNAPASAGPQSLLAPSAGLRDRQGDHAIAWVVDADGRLEGRQVRVLGTERDGWVPVGDGLRLGDPVVVGAVDGLESGRRARAVPAEGR